MLKTATRLSAAAAELWRGIDAVDQKAVKRRVDELRRRSPKASKDELHRNLVYAKCLQTGAIGALSSATAMIPGVGRAVGAVLGPLADATLVTTLQAELVAETVAVYGGRLPEQAERVALVGIAATQIGSHKVAGEIARMLARQAPRGLGGPIGLVAAPLARIATAAVTNVVTTYAIGMRSRALAKMKDAPLEEWPDLIRQVTMIDERRLTRWATESAKTAMEQAGVATRAVLGKLASLAPDLSSFSLPDARPAARKRSAAASPRSRKPRKARPEA